MTQGPVVFDVDDPEAASPATADPVPELGAPTGQAMQSIATYAARPTSRFARWAWGAVLGLIGLIASVAAWDFVNGLLARSPILGGLATVLIVVVVLALIVVILRELSAFARLRRVDGVHRAAEQALAAGDLGQARKVIDSLQRLYRGRDDTQWGRDRLKERSSDAFDADTLLGMAETDLLAPLDAAATREVEAAARQVATVTALVPLALADLFTALAANLRMIRRIAEIYGGRGGTLGSWRLTKTVFAHLVATGAVAVGDDMLEPLIGGGILGKLSRRFGEGMVNGALTARVGVAAIEVCRPLPFTATKRPWVRQLVQRALTGVFKNDD